MMTLEEAIKHCDEVIQHYKEKSCGDSECANEHRQLSEWLKELKKLRFQKQQMMKDAIECHIDYYDGPILDCTQKQLDDALEKNETKVGDKVKVIIIKE